MKLTFLLEFKPSTRFGATPIHQNTFYNYQGKESLNPMSITSCDRFNRGLISNTKFQSDEKKTRESKDLAKLENIRKYQKSISDKVEDGKARNLERENNKIKTMGLAQWSYEHVLQIYHHIKFITFFFHSFRGLILKIIGINENFAFEFFIIRKFSTILL